MRKDGALTMNSTIFQKCNVVAIVWILATAIVVAMAGQSAEAKAGEFKVVDVTPNNKTVDVELEPLIQIHLSEKFDLANVNNTAVQLRNASGKNVDVDVTGDLGGVITVHVNRPLQPGTKYELRVTSALTSRNGRSLRPMSVKFTTTRAVAVALRNDIADFRFLKTRIDRRDGVTGLALNGDRLFACTWDGKIVAYQLGDDGDLVSLPKVHVERKRRFNAIAVDPKSVGDKTILWGSHDSQQGLSLGPNDFSGTISRFTITSNGVSQEDVIFGLPTGDHPASGLVFGPDGRLFVSQGALSMLGGKPSVPETPLSAATLAVDVDHALFKKSLPVNVKYFDKTTNPAAIEVFATGIREAYDLCWHSSGSLFAGVNMNDTNERTPKKDDLPSVNVRPAEMMLRIVRGKYYGHPNPSRNEWVLLGGNPTDGIDPWEVASLPVGTQPEASFDPTLLIRNLEQDKGPSADGVCEWTAEGPLKRRLLFCFYTATRGIHTYRVGESGLSVDDPQSLVDKANRVLRFGAPLDIVHDERGWLYVADFSAPSRGDSGKAGGVWLVKPLRKRR